MKIPEPNSRLTLILRSFLPGPLTIWQGIELHGDFPSPASPQGMDHSKVLKIYDELVARGCLVREGILYRLALAARYRLEPLPDRACTVAQPKRCNVWAGPPRHYLAATPWIQQI